MAADPREARQTASRPRVKRLLGLVQALPRPRPPADYYPKTPPRPILATYWRAIGAVLAEGPNMATTALAEPKSGPISAPTDAAQLRSLITGILMTEYGSTGIWEQAAKRAACRILEAIEGVTANRL